MLVVDDFRTRVVRPVLAHLAQWNAAMNGPAAENLLVGTALQESLLTHLVQSGGGPGLGVMQIETATHDDVWRNYLDYRSDLAGMVRQLAAGGHAGAGQLVWNLGYSVAMARLVYWRAPGTLPGATDIDGLGHYWKTHYNTVNGAGRAGDWADKYRRYAAKDTPATG